MEVLVLVTRKVGNKVNMIKCPWGVDESEG